MNKRQKSKNMEYGIWNTEYVWMQKREKEKEAKRKRERERE